VKSNLGLVIGLRRAGSLGTEPSAMGSDTTYRYMVSELAGVYSSFVGRMC
jgi:hypothetical protein